jgi:hypothetical protein
MSADTDMVKLKACPLPWCRKSRPVLAQGGFRNGSYRVQCETCGCASPRFYERSKAITAWNTRAALDASGIGEMVEALTAISGQAICYGMAAEENELRDWLKFISETAEAALSRARATVVATR